MPDRDVIELLGVRAKGYHGVLDFERRDGQDFVVDVLMGTDLSRAGASDDLADTVSYAEIAAAVVARIEGEPLDLIEALAERIAGDVLLRPEIGDVEVVVHKPQAPVGVPFGDVRVRVRRTRRSAVVVALGSNLGDSTQTLHDAVDALRAHVDLTAVSRSYATDPVGGPEQPDYVNAVAVGTTSLTPWALLAALHGIEAGHGRTREVRWGPRTLDLDLVTYGTTGGADEARLDAPVLTVPHPRAHERAFVLVPWLDADPDARLRVDGEVRAVAELVTALDTTGVRAVDGR